jgi:hypothetical protein
MESSQQKPSSALGNGALPGPRERTQLLRGSHTVIEDSSATVLAFISSLIIRNSDSDGEFSLSIVSGLR